MNSEVKDKAAKTLKSLGCYITIFAVNTMRRALILGRYTLICAIQQRLRRAQRRLGKMVLEALKQGEVNPMLTEGVKDALDKAEAVQTGKDKQYQAIEAIREKIRSACATPASDQ